MTQSRHLGTEAGTAQFPLIQHATDIGWTALSPAAALRARGGEGGSFLYDTLRERLLRLNPGFITTDNVQSVITRLESLPASIEGNREMLGWLRGQQTMYDQAEQRERAVILIDYAEPSNNDFHVSWEWTWRQSSRKGNRADIVFAINGIPVAIVENKNPKQRDALERGVVQLRRYERETPELLVATQLFNVTHMLTYHYGVTWNYARNGIFDWKEVPSETYREAVRSFFEPRGFLLMLREWILFFMKDDVLRKTVLRQHQTRAAVKVVNRCADPAKRRGLVWHTQGSGKTFTLLTAARLILEDTERFPGATVMLVVDRDELQGQLAGWVDRTLGGMRSAGIAVKQAESRAHLQDLLDADFRGLIVSMIHKFTEVRAHSCTRDNFFVLIDEAHRSVSGPDLGNYLTGALPNATLVGFTGTPIDKTAVGQGTFKTFGGDDTEGYLDKYSIRESIADGTTVPLRHTMAPVDLTLEQELLEEEFLGLAEAEGVSDIEELNRILERAVRLRAFLKAPARVDAVARFVAQHFRENVEPLGYKAFVVGVDREACALYKDALDRYLPWEYSVPVYTSSASDVTERPLVAAHQLTPVNEKAARKAFGRPENNPRIFIVTDKLLTGFDAPVLYCMYLDKPMRDHVLLQAVARVNRPFEDERGVKKPCGLVIDFVGVLRELNKALAFDSRDVSGVIEDLDQLLVQFKALMDGAGVSYLASTEGPGTNDEIVDRLIGATFFDKTHREEFIQFFRTVEALYEILSPSAELREYIEPYNRLADLYALLRNAYGERGGFGLDLAHKTERLVREGTGVTRAIIPRRELQFDAKALDSLRTSNEQVRSDVVNLVRQLEGTAETADQQPHLVSIAERARGVLDQLEERQLSTEQALDEISRLMRDRQQAERVRDQEGLDGATFSIYWALRHELPSDALALAREMRGVQVRYPNAATNSDEYRQMKAELYRITMRFVTGHRMVDLVEAVLASTVA